MDFVKMQIIRINTYITSLSAATSGLINSLREKI